MLRQALGPSVKLVVPGIRPEGAASGDQARTMTPRRRWRQAPTGSLSAARSPARRDPACRGSGNRRQHPMTQVKICGINDPVAFDTAVEAGADWIGFNFFPPSPRYRDP